MYNTRINWFNRYAAAREILIEAGWKENIATGMLAAILMVFAGSTIKAAADRNNVKEKDLIKAMQDRPTVERVYEVYEEEQPEAQKNFNTPITQPQMPQKQLNNPKRDITPKTNFNDIINTIIGHESLALGQTPFRITNPNMKNWSKIHGFEINKNPKAPSNRQNFIYLKNPQEVPLAVKKQFENYAYNPKKYGLPENPTLEDALKVFDQTGTKGKMEFIKKRLPFVNLKAPLSDLLSA